MPRLTHVIEAKQFDRETMTELFANAREMDDMFRRGETSDILTGRTMVELYFEESYRTRFSFAQAMRMLGGEVDSFQNTGRFSSMIKEAAVSEKGERLRDAVRVMNELYFSVIVLRHPMEGSAKEAAEASQVPVINAGDGPGQAPNPGALGSLHNTRGVQWRD